MKTEVLKNLYAKLYQTIIINKDIVLYIHTDNRIINEWDYIIEHINSNGFNVTVYRDYKLDDGKTYTETNCHFFTYAGFKKMTFDAFSSTINIMCHYAQ